MTARGWKSAAFGLAGLLAACETVVPATRNEPAAFKVEIVCAANDVSGCPAPTAGDTICPPATGPADLGTPATPVDRLQRYYLAQVSALSSNGEAATSFAGTANVYVQYDGSVSPTRDAVTPPLQRLPFAAGKACLALTIPAAFNKTTLWVEDSGETRSKGSFAIGVSKPIHRPSPLISDVQTPDAHPPVPPPEQTQSPLNNKHVLIEDGTDGQPIIVTAVFAQSFTVTDTGTPGLDHPFGSLLVYSFSQPHDVHVGSRVGRLNGTLSEFNGLTELNFPIWDVNPAPPDLSLVPAPHEIKVADITKTLEKMEPYESALVELKGWKVCTLTGRDLDGYTKYGQWKIAPAPKADGTCTDAKTSMSIISGSTVPGFDPIAQKGKTVCSLRGILSQVVPGKGVNLWMVTPRDTADMPLVDTSCP